MNKRALLLGAFTVLALTTGCSVPTTKTEVWEVLERRLEGPHIFQSSIGWRPVYNDMVDRGLSPRRVARHILKAARHGPHLRGVLDLLKEHQSADALDEALEVAHAEAADVLEEWKAEVRRSPNYEHMPIFVGDRELRWRKLADDLERPPIYANAFLWHDIFTDMCKLGMDQEIAAKCVLRAAKFGPSRNDLVALLSTATSVPKLRAELSRTYSQSVDRLYEDEPEWLGYWHFPKGAEAWIEEQRKRERQRRIAPPPVLPPEMLELKKRRQAPVEQPAEPEAEIDAPEFFESDFDSELREDPDLDAEFESFDDPDMVEDDLEAPPALDEVEDELPDEAPIDDELPEMEDDDGELPGLDEE